MKTADLAALMKEIAPVIREYTESVIRPVAEKLDQLAKRLDELPAPCDGKDADEEAIVSRVVAEVAKALDEAKAALADVPQAPAVDPDELRDLVKQETRAAVEALPKPQDGKSVTLDDVRPLIEEAVAAAVAGLPKPKDGIGIKALLIDQKGDLVATLDDGTLYEVGHVVGKDADMAALERQIEEKIAALPKPKDGRDGFSLKNFDVAQKEDGRTIELTFADDEQTFTAELAFPVMIYRGVYKEGQTYAKGDTVTWGGSLWHCDVDGTTEKPDGGEKHWTLAAKRGRDGKDAK